jgi:diguanylate cyclase (GGDEF)-like protein
VAERVRAAVAEFPFLDGEQPIKVTVSAGVATHPSSSSVQSADEFLKTADRALYAAKNGGKNRVVVG